MEKLLMLLAQLAAIAGDAAGAIDAVVKLMGQVDALPADEFDAKVAELDASRAPAIAAALERIKAAIPK